MKQCLIAFVNRIKIMGTTASAPYQTFLSLPFEDGNPCVLNVLSPPIPLGMMNRQTGFGLMLYLELVANTMRLYGLNI
jgi:hypothetical protein